MRLLIISVFLQVVKLKYYMCLHSQDPIRSALIDSCIRVTDNGRASINRSVRDKLRPNFPSGFYFLLSHMSSIWFIQFQVYQMWANYLGILVAFCRFSIYLHFIVLLTTTINLRYGKIISYCNKSDLHSWWMETEDDLTLQLGARSSEEAASWIRLFMEAALKVLMLTFLVDHITWKCDITLFSYLQECPNKEENFVACSKRKRQSLRSEEAPFPLHKLVINYSQIYSLLFPLDNSRTA